MKLKSGFVAFTPSRHA